jgi:hypothetical protein
MLGMFCCANTLRFKFREEDRKDMINLNRNSGERKSGERKSGERKSGKSAGRMSDLELD